MQPQACVVPSARFRFGHTGLGTLLGTLGAFFNRSVEKSERKRAEATVSLTVASPGNISIDHFGREPPTLTAPFVIADGFFATVACIAITPACAQRSHPT